MGNGVIRFLGDSLVNLVSMLGTARDKASSSVHVFTPLDDASLLAAYRGSWLPRKIIDIPAFDAFRKWRDWQAEADVIELLEEEEKRLNLRGKLMQTKIKARLFGWAALFIGNGDADLMLPLDPARIKKGGLLYLHVMTPRMLGDGEIDRDPASAYFGRPMYYVLQNDTGQLRIHPSRLVIMQGASLPDDELCMNPLGVGRGDSILNSVMSAIRNADATAANIASLVFEAKIDVIRIPNMMEALADPAYKTRLLERFTTAAAGKGINGVLMLDKEEEYEQKTASFATLPDILNSFLQIVSGAADIPVTRLLGQSPAGMSATGESDLRNYYDKVAAMQTVEIDPEMAVLTECLIWSATGSRDPAIHYIWASLWQMTDKERAEIGKIDADTINVLNSTGLYPPEALATAGANMLVEHSIMPGFNEAIQEAGGLPDYEAELEAEQKLAAEAANANNAPGSRKIAANDAIPKPLYVRRDVLNAEDIRAWYEAQGVEKMMPASDFHVTIIYSKTAIDWFAVSETWQSELKLSAGGPRDHEFFGPPGNEDSLVLMIKSSELQWRHEEFKRHGATTSFDEYQPHVTLIFGNADRTMDISDIEPWQGEILLGPEIFEAIDENWQPKK